MRERSPTDTKSFPSRDMHPPRTRVVAEEISLVQMTKPAHRTKRKQRRRSASASIRQFRKRPRNSPLLPGAPGRESHTTTRSGAPMSWFVSRFEIPRTCPGHSSLRTGPPHDGASCINLANFGIGTPVRSDGRRDETCCDFGLHGCQLRDCRMTGLMIPPAMRTDRLDIRSRQGWR